MHEREMSLPSEIAQDEWLGARALARQGEGRHAGAPTGPDGPLHDAYDKEHA
jgi:hypothetical protein